MSDADGFDDGQYHRALNMVAGAVFAVRFGGSDVEVGDISSARPQGEAETRKE